MNKKTKEMLKNFDIHKPVRKKWEINYSMTNEGAELMASEGWEPISVTYNPNDHIGYVWAFKREKIDE